MIKAYRYRLYPTKQQIQTMESQLDLCRWLYNTALDQRITAYKKLNKSISYNDQQNELPLIRKTVPGFSDIHSQVLQDVLRRLDKSFRNFFRGLKQHQKIGFPRFKSRGRLNSITYTQSGFSVKGNRVHLSKIGPVKIRHHRGMVDGGKIKMCTVVKSGDHWYCCLVVEYLLKVKQKIITDAVGIDLGINSFAVLSDGVVIDNPRYYRKSQDKLKEVQSKYSIHKGKKTKRRLSAIHRKTFNQRKDFLHKESRKIVDTYDLIAHESLNIRGLVKLGLSKSIHDAGWGTFINMLTYKAEEAGTHIIAVNPYNTSQSCCKCGTVVKKTLSQRQHNCPNCGLSMDRDLNAAHNILKLGTDLVPFGPETHI